MYFGKKIGSSSKKNLMELLPVVDKIFFRKIYAPDNGNYASYHL